MHTSYSFPLVAISIFVGALAGYTTLDLASRIATLTARWARQLWLAGGAVALGISVWSMHFVGMLSMSLPITVGYDLTLTGLSLVLAIGIAYVALYLMARPMRGWACLIVEGVVVGAGLAAMHYTGMAAMLMSPAIVYDRTLFIASVAIAVVASCVAIYIARALIAGKRKHLVQRRMLAAVLMGLFITAMHYTGMAAATFLPGAICGAASGINPQWLATTVTVFTLAVMIVSFLLSLYDQRTTMLAGSLSELNGQIVRMTTYDSLTNLPNRRTLHERINAVIAMSEKQTSGFAVLFVDLDNFKAINDSFGQAAGDHVLQSFARRLLDSVRGGDTVAHLGGDQFVILLQSASADSAESLAVRISHEMRVGSWDDAQPYQVSPSIGIALFPENGRSVDELLRNADAAMHDAKRNEYGAYRFFDASMNQAAERTLQLQRALHESLIHGYFSIDYQAKYCCDGMRVVGAEALLRLHHPCLGTLSPMAFIPIAERSGQIIPIGSWVVREVCRQIQTWLAEGHAPIKIAVNLSPKQLLQADLLDSILALLREEGIAPKSIMFEITESVAMEDAARTVEMVKEFEAAGFDIAIDDFGTGYSSLAYLQRFRVKQLKIDRFFVDGLDAHGAQGRAIVTAIIALAHALNMEVVAEGVETHTQLALLQQMRCDQMQGYLLGKPVPPKQFVHLLTGADTVA
ncbi:EAL domain-containing protein [Robbsia sp. KACC 23696]|uniref:putative bifunctional diguanylate cyclase/phosphodiesterase n=1 Tax=Robbsia sp. KACC 23696 TaxID=3149231 RepID=UPI00325A4926